MAATECRPNDQKSVSDEFGKRKGNQNNTVDKPQYDSYNFFMIQIKDLFAEGALKTKNPFSLIICPRSTLLLVEQFSVRYFLNFEF